jgi:hypothetical protein
VRSLFHIRNKGHIRTREEAEGHILSHLVLFLSRSSAQGQDELFSCKGSGGARLILRGHAVREAINITCDLNDLPRDIFSSHSLRKCAISDMRMLGVASYDRTGRIMLNRKDGAEIADNMRAFHMICEVLNN